MAHQPDPNCPHCRGTGKVPLLISEVPCDCLLPPAFPKFLGGIVHDEKRTAVSGWTDQKYDPRGDMEAVQKSMYGRSPLEMIYRTITEAMEMENRFRRLYLGTFIGTEPETPGQIAERTKTTWDSFPEPSEESLARYREMIHSVQRMFPWLFPPENRAAKVPVICWREEYKHYVPVGDGPFPIFNDLVDVVVPFDFENPGYIPTGRHTILESKQYRIVNDCPCAELILSASASRTYSLVVKQLKKQMTSEGAD